MIIDDLIRLMHLLREHFKKLSFDFFSCFYFDKEQDCFVPHKEEYKACIEDASDVKLVLKLREPPLSLFLAIQAGKIVEQCLWQAFPLSSHFGSKLRVLCLRGFQQIAASFLQQIFLATPEMAHLDLSYCKQVDDETVVLIGKLFRDTLLSLQLRSCHEVTDDGIIGMSENFSGAHEHRKVFPNPINDG